MLQLCSYLDLLGLDARQHILSPSHCKVHRFPPNDARALRPTARVVASRISPFRTASAAIMIPMSALPANQRTQAATARAVLASASGLPSPCRLPTTACTPSAPVEGESKVCKASSRLVSPAMDATHYWIEPLAGAQDWPVWKVRLTDILTVSGLWGYVSGSSKCPEALSDSEAKADAVKKTTKNSEIEKWKENDRKALSTI
ncbi:hypothetical protein AcV7_006611 [Taiwanofungus camphoratus]|nr:hypothetical protein AcV7_006611 [Antrodia cinnamomea]